MNPTGRIRRSSAGSRRHHVAYLPFKIRALVPEVDSILIIPLPDADTIRDVTVYDSDDRALTLQPEVVAHLLGLLQTAHPEADWGQPLRWQVDGNRFGPAIPADAA
ncbi:hypothetical protein ABZ547_08535 [Streptomyces sparsogenes]|uniref:hypothetical protein n=1 Tax=Streptomyces sparsogenes TaxID=67365 RepID=UPI0033CC3174